MLPDVYEHQKNLKYPPRGELKRILHQRLKDDYLHIGYFTEKARPCPCCKTLPVFEEDIYRAAPEGHPAKYFIGFCQKCGLRTRSSAKLRDAINQWQRKEYSEGSWLMAHRPKCSDLYGVRLLCKQVVGKAIDDALLYVQARNSASPGGEEFHSYKNLLNELEHFFRESPFMWELSANGLISDIRKVIYPDIPPEYRIKIPLHLAELYKGKAVREECRKKNLLKSPAKKEATAQKRSHKYTPGTIKRTYTRKTTL